MVPNDHAVVHIHQKKGERKEKPSMVLYRHRHVHADKFIDASAAFEPPDLEQIELIAANDRRAFVHDGFQRQEGALPDLSLRRIEPTEDFCGGGIMEQITDKALFLFESADAVYLLKHRR